ncbi:MAG TPA: hypothetical protein DG577_04640 [Firmicutes bacterium]|nr:hypothetical protein [Bacillota bacterium]
MAYLDFLIRMFFPSLFLQEHHFLVGRSKRGIQLNSTIAQIGSSRTVPTLLPSKWLKRAIVSLPCLQYNTGEGEDS